VIETWRNTTRTLPTMRHAEDPWGRSGVCITVIQKGILNLLIDLIAQLDRSINRFDQVCGRDRL